MHAQRPSPSTTVVSPTSTSSATSTHTSNAAGRSSRQARSWFARTGRLLAVLFLVMLTPLGSPSIRAAAAPPPISRSGPAAAAHSPASVHAGTLGLRPAATPPPGAHYHTWSPRAHQRQAAAG